jgi:hypothetical protein
MDSYKLKPQDILTVIFVIKNCEIEIPELHMAVFEKVQCKKSKLKAK